MRIEFFILSVIVVLVSGCVSYRAGNLKEITANELEKPPQSTCSYFAGPGAGWLKDVAQGLGAFGSCREEGGTERELVPGEIRITYAGRGCMDDMKDDDDTWVAVSAASLFLIPARQEFRGECRYTVEDWQGKKASYVFADSTVHWFGLLVVFAMPFYEETDSLQLGLDIQRAALGNLAVAMRRDGFFSADKAAAAKADVVEAAKKTVAARRKDLEDLKKAGIIDEAEYAAEVKKLAGAGK